MDMVAGHAVDPWRGIGRWADALAHLQGRIARRFGRAEVREWVRRYLVGLLERVERKNGWQLAEAVGEAGPRGRGACSACSAPPPGTPTRCGMTCGPTWFDHLGDPASGVLIIDDTGFVKKGDRSCGVGRQCTGNVGDTADAQVGVFLAYASAKGATFMNRARYLPRGWTDDPDRCRAAGIPAAERFTTKLTLAQRMLARVFAAAVPQHGSWPIRRMDDRMLSAYPPERGRRQRPRLLSGLRR